MIEQLSLEVFVVHGTSNEIDLTQEIANGVKEIGKNYIIKDIVPVSGKLYDANPTTAVFVFVEPR